MRIEFRDGYIDLEDTGNTYVGNMAHDILHQASKLSREHNYSFNGVLKSICVAMQRRIYNNLQIFGHL